mmetsp:Transcript_26067/g.62611  ORF Transcript_26067/g.62611 Transcript_26067/m.62611 type:complete len:393 (-) Transcript_26067:219-1397(-)
MRQLGIPLQRIEHLRPLALRNIATPLHHDGGEGGIVRPQLMDEIGRGGDATLRQLELPVARREGMRGEGRGGGLGPSARYSWLCGDGGCVRLLWLARRRRLLSLFVDRIHRAPKCHHVRHRVRRRGAAVPRALGAPPLRRRGLGRPCRRPCRVSCVPGPDLRQPPLLLRLPQLVVLHHGLYLPPSKPVVLLFAFLGIGMGVVVIGGIALVVPLLVYRSGRDGRHGGPVPPARALVLRRSLLLHRHFLDTALIRLRPILCLLPTAIAASLLLRFPFIDGFFAAAIAAPCNGGSALEYKIHHLGLLPTVIFLHLHEFLLVRTLHFRRQLGSAVPRNAPLPLQFIEPFPLSLMLSQEFLRLLKVPSLELLLLREEQIPHERGVHILLFLLSGVIG